MATIDAKTAGEMKAALAAYLSAILTAPRNLTA